jgi:hypothetical protein
MTLRSPTPDTGQSKVLGPGIEYSTLRTTGKVIANSRDFEVSATPLVPASLLDFFALRACWMGTFRLLVCYT